MTRAKKKQRQKPTPMLPGYDGAKIASHEVRISHARSYKGTMRARPGTFEWRYGRESSRKSVHTALHLAGSHFARTWEKAGSAGHGTINFAESGHIDWKGMPDGRVAALDELRLMVRAIGILSSSRLFRYCVRGETTAEIAKEYEVPQRHMASVLHEDLRAVALHYRYLRDG